MTACFGQDSFRDALRLFFDGCRMLVRGRRYTKMNAAMLLLPCEYSGLQRSSGPCQMLPDDLKLAIPTPTKKPVSKQATLAPGQSLLVRADIGGFGAGSELTWQTLATYSFQMCVTERYAIDGYLGYSGVFRRLFARRRQ